MGAFPLELDTLPMEATLVKDLPEQDGGWQYEPKWDGFRCLAFKFGDLVELRSKSGKSLSRYFPEVVQLLQGTKIERFVIDGELVVRINDHLSFEELQMRLHPAASRVDRLSSERPANLIAFDLLVDPEVGAVLHRELEARRQGLEALLASTRPKGLILSPASRSLQQARDWLRPNGYADTDGVIAKRLDQPYLPGERAMLKVKRVRTADCVVGGFRYGVDTHQVASLLLGLYADDGLLHHVGFTSALSSQNKRDLTVRLENIRTGVSFTGKAPGAPSRWSGNRSSEWNPVRPELVVEVKFDHVTGGRFRHGTSFNRWRPDKSPLQCTFDQLENS